MTTYETLNLLVTAGSIIAILAMMYHGIRVMARGAEIRAADSERKHDESMTSLRELIEGQAESRMALREALIEGEESGPATPFDFDAFIARKKST